MKKTHRQPVWIATLLVLFVSSFATASDDARERAFLLILNGREFPGTESELPFYPCRANVLEFRLEWHRIEVDEVLVKIRKTAPDASEWSDGLPSG